MSDPRDPRLRRQHAALRHGAPPPVDALAAAVRLDLAVGAMRAEQLERGPERSAADVAATVQGGTVEPPLTAAEFAAALAVDEPYLEQAWREDNARDDYEPDDEPDDEPATVEAPTAPAVPPTAPAVCRCGEVRPGESCPAHPFDPTAYKLAAPFSSERSLTWRSRHDERSRLFGVRARLRGSAPVQDKMWPVGPVLDQGTEGACVGAAIADAVNVELAAQLEPPLDLTDALRLYHRAQQLDEVPGESYTGTSVLAGMQAAVEAGLFGGYLWAFGTRDVAQAVLQRGPVVVGVPWLSGMYETGPGGLVSLEGSDVGGHCLAVVGIKLKGPQGQPGPFFGWQNSWGADYGDGGIGWIHHRDLARLLHGRGEAAIPTVEAQAPRE